MKKVIALLLIAVLALGLVACGNEPAAPAAPADPAAPAAPADPAAPAAPAEEEKEFVKMNLAYATFLQDFAPSAGIYENVQAKLDEKMGGAIQITPYTSGSLLGQNDIFDGVISGVADIGFVQCSALADRLNVTLLLEQAGLYYTGSTSASYVMRDYLNELMPEELEDVIVLAVTNTAPNSILSTTPIHTVEDLKGLQIRASGAAADAVAALGGTPVSLTMGEIYEGLRSGLVDGAWFLPSAVGSNKLHEVAGYQVIVPIGGACQLVVMNKDVFYSMPEHQQELFMEIWDEVFEEFIAVYVEDYSSDRHTGTVEGIVALEELSYLEGEELDRWLELTSGIVEEYAAELDAKGLNGTEALALARELCDKYNAIYPASISYNAHFMWREGAELR